MTLSSGANCYAEFAASLVYVTGYSINSWSRVCAASYDRPYGTRNSDWVCDYGFAVKYINRRVIGVGALHNGDRYSFYAYGVQEY